MSGTAPEEKAKAGQAPTFLFASDSFKGTLSSQRIAELLSEEAQAVFPPVSCRSLVIADGGEGTVESLLRQVGGKRVSLRVQGPLMLSVEASYGLLANSTAVIEMAAASGLTLIAPEERNPLLTSTYGTGQLIRSALDKGARDLLIGIGGSATVDGGMGALSALGVRFWDGGNWEVPACGGNLGDVRRVDLSGLDARLAACRIRIVCDVDNPLLGPTGAARVFGPQKGADPAMVEELEAGMASYARALAQAVGRDLSAQPGAGAAGGLGLAFSAVLGAELLPGIECLLDLVGFDQMLADADLCITGEGRLDGQTLHGKAISGVAARCKAAGVPCAALVGSVGSDVDRAALAQAGIGSVSATAPVGAGWDEVVAHAEDDYRRAARVLFEEWAGR